MALPIFRIIPCGQRILDTFPHQATASTGSGLREHTLCKNRHVLASDNTLHNFYTVMARVVLEKGVTANTRGHVRDDRMREADVRLIAAHLLGAHTAALNALTSQLPDKWERKYVQGPGAQVLSRRAGLCFCPRLWEIGIWPTQW